MLEDTTLYSCRFLSFVFVAVVGTVCFYLPPSVQESTPHIKVLAAATSFIGLLMISNDC